MRILKPAFSKEVDDNGNIGKLLRLFDTYLKVYSFRRIEISLQLKNAWSSASFSTNPNEFSVNNVPCEESIRPGVLIWQCRGIDDVSSPI